MDCLIRIQKFRLQGIESFTIPWIRLGLSSVLVLLHCALGPENKRLVESYASRELFGGHSAITSGMATWLWRC